MKTYEGRLIPLQKNQIIFIARDITEQKKKDEEKDIYYQLLKKETADIKILHGILPICSSCKNIRDKNDNWKPIENYIKTNSEADFTHTLCPECVKKFYPNLE
jgi:hypothetical protein